MMEEDGKGGAMTKIIPLRVAIMDDDYFALEKKASLLARDVRTQLCARCESARELLDYLRELEGGKRPHAINLDTEHRAPDIPLGLLITRIREIAPETAIICLSQ
jgi:hypothetical protein